MQATRTPAGTASATDPPRHPRGQSPPATRPAGPSTQILDIWSGEEFLSRFGDAIDDRIAEILDELLDERNAAHPHRRLPRVLGTVTLILALTASVLLRHSALAAWTIWPATAAVSLAIAWTTGTRRS
jgi:hypothetical protein